jgi:hypothetical protein
MKDAYCIWRTKKAKLQDASRPTTLKARREGPSEFEPNAKEERRCLEVMTLSLGHGPSQRQ